MTGEGEGHREPPERFTDIRPWGKFEQFVQNRACSVKIITIESGQQLSLQSHRLRSEWWVVLDDAMDVELDGQRLTLKRNDEIFIPVGSKHRVFGLSKPCRWLEISFGLFDENDITRYEDSYGRMLNKDEG